MEMQNIPQQNSENATTSNKPKSSKKTWVILGIVLVAALIALGLIWFFLSARQNAAEDANRVNNGVANYAENTTNSMNNTTSNTTSNVTNNATNTTTTSTVPTTLSKATLNGTPVYYPKSWGTLKVNTSTENISTDSPLSSTYAGAYLSITETPFTYISVMNASSYLKDSDNIQEVVSYLQKVYGKQAVQEADAQTLSYPLIPIQNAGIKMFHPKYLYSKDTNWRGFWYLANIAQEPGLSPYVIGLLYNSAEKKVYTYERVLTSSTITKKQGELNPDNSKADTVVADYLGSGYTKDSEAMAEINEFLQMAEYTGMN